MRVAVFGPPETPLPTQLKNSHWLYGDSMLLHEDQSDSKMQTNESFACREDKRQQGKCSKTNLVRPLLPGQVPPPLIETIQCHGSKNTSIPCLKVGANILSPKVTWSWVMLNAKYYEHFLLSIKFPCVQRVCEWERTGRPTAMLRREILLTPALKLTPWLKVNFGKSKLP